MTRIVFRSGVAGMALVVAFCSQAGQAEAQGFQPGVDRAH